MSSAQELQTIPYVDLERYAGLWYEIASYPQRFQEGCTATTAEYTLSDKGYVIVENRCNKYTLDGKQSYIKGKAFVVKNSGNAKLKVQFFWPFRGSYWIIDLADDYNYAVVSHPGKNTCGYYPAPANGSCNLRWHFGTCPCPGLDTDKLKVTLQAE